MELNIGTNIKRLRIAKGLTQEHLAELLCVSAAAVSKWESKISYPDIAMLFPIAKILEVNMDELLGYDAEEEKREISNILSEYKKLYLNGEFKKASDIIKKAQKKFPYDYSIMRKYMWDIAGGTSGNKAELLLQNKDELERICELILNGCNDDNIRIDALNLKAKLLHAQNDTDGAIGVLSLLPSGYAEQAKEALFEKSSAEYRYWNQRNCYSYVDSMARKLARTIRFDPSLSSNEKIARAEAMAKEFAVMSSKKDLGFFCAAECAIYAVIAGSLSATDDIYDIIRIREKEFCAMRKMTDFAKCNEPFKDSIVSLFKTENIIRYEVERLLTSPHPQLSKLRESPEYLQMLLKWKNS